MIEVSQATLADAIYVARHLREKDLMEVQALGATPSSALVVSFYDSDECYTVRVDGVIAMIYGVYRGLLSDHGVIWALGTPQFGKVPLASVKRGRKIVQEFVEKYGVLENYCDARNKEVHRWLKLLGFTLDDPKPYGPKGKAFRKLKAESNENPKTLEQSEKANNEMIKEKTFQTCKPKLSPFAQKISEKFLCL